MIHAQVTVKPLGGEFAQANRRSETFEVCGFDRINCEQKALDMFGDYSQIAAFREFDPDYPPQNFYNGDDDN